MFSNRISRRPQFGTLLMFEFLENRRLLAGDLRVGDANEDYYFDEADVVQVTKFAKLDTGEAATWNEGDWNEDGIVTRDDFIDAFLEGHYRKGPYDDAAEAAVNHLQPISLAGESDTTIFYFPATGYVTAVASSTSKLSALHLVSRSGSFTGHRGSGPFFNRQSGVFDVASPDSQFLWTTGASWIEHHDLLPLGWNAQQVLDDLLVDGALLGGGGLGNVRLGLPSDFPEERPEDVWETTPEVLPTFVTEDAANALLTYDPRTGDIRIEAIDVTIFAIKLLSPDGLFTGATPERHDEFVPHSLDFANPTEFGRIARDASGPFNIFDIPEMTRIFLPGIARTGLSADELTAGMHPWGFINNETDALQVALEIGPLFTECERHVADEVMVGDANLDGQFNSQDLVTIFQAGEFDDAELGNSTWSEGDWTCDGDFGTDDLVAAFQAGQYEAPAAALAIRAFDEPSRMTSLRFEENHADALPDSFELDATRMARSQWVAVELVDIATFAYERHDLVISEAVDHVFTDLDSMAIEL